MTTADLDRYFGGQALYGDDFGPDQLNAWYAGEIEGYSSTDHADAQAPVYYYHALGHRTGFSYLPSDRRFETALGVGSAFAEEYEPIRHRIGNLVVLDPSAKFVRNTVHGIPVRYEKPDPSGKMPFTDGTFDLITCFGVLHHIANVSTVVREFARVLRPDGYALIREPIISLGDWRHPRVGLTRNERGIPLAVFRRIIDKSGLEIVAEKLTTFGPLGLLSRRMKLPTFNSPTLTSIDLGLSRLFAANTRYHRVSFLQKIGPTGVAYVLRKK